MTPTWPFISTWALGKNSEVSWFRFFLLFSKAWGIKNSPNILKNSLLTIPVSQGGERPSFPTPANSLNPSDSSDGTKTSLPTRRTIQDFYQLICPWYQSQFEHYLVYILAIKLWLPKERLLFDTGWPWYFLDSGENWLKWIFFFLGNGKTIYFCICNYKQLAL